MAKAALTSEPVNPLAPIEAETMVAEFVAAHPGAVAPANFSFRVFHRNDPTKAVGRFVGTIDYERFSEEAVAEKWGIAGDFYADLVCNRSVIGRRGNLLRIHFGIDENLVATSTAPAAQAPTTGLAGTAPVTGSNVLDVLLPMFLESQRQQGQLMIALATKPAPASGMSDALMTTILGHALTKSPVSDVVALAEKLSGKMGERQDQDDGAEDRGGGMGVELMRTLRQMLRLAEKAPAGGPMNPPTPTHEPAPAPITAPDTAPAANPPTSPAPDAKGPGLSGTPKANPADLDDVGKLRLFGARVVPQLIDFATDPEPSIDGAASMIEATAIRCGIDPAKFAQADDLAADVVDPVVGLYPDLSPHRAFALAALEALADQYADDDDDGE